MGYVREDGSEFAFPRMEIIVDETGRLNSLRCNLLRDVPKFFDALATEVPRETSIAIVGAGPSLRKTISQVKKFRGPIMAAGSGHDFLRKHGVFPDFAVNLDPDRNMPKYFTEPYPRTTFLLSSTSDPALFDHIAEWACPIVMWNSAGEAPQDAFIDQDAVAGGTTVATRAWALAYLMGYRKFVFYGIDSSFPDMADQHADRENSDAYNHWLPVHVGGEWGSRTVFRTSVQLMQQSQDFMQFYSWCREQPGTEIVVKGHSLTREYAAAFERERAARRAA